MGGSSARASIVSQPHGLSLDSGALIAIERGDTRMRALLRRALGHGLPIHVVTGVVAQTWRGDARQARLASFLDVADVRFPVLDLSTARTVGAWCGRSGPVDLVDVHVAVDAALHDLAVVTADPDDIGAVAPNVPLIPI